MTGALVILLAMIVVGVLLYVTDVAYFRHHHAPATDPDNQKPEPLNPTVEDVCCGQHLVCEKTSLVVLSDEIVYYDDEELDRFSGRLPESYTSEETEEFRDVLLTLLPHDVPGWARSITLRNIQLPHDVKDELLLLLSELRAS